MNHNGKRSWLFMAGYVDDARGLTSISSRSAQILIWKGPGWDEAGMGTVVAAGLGVWIREINLGIN